MLDDTLVTYPGGSLREDATVREIAAYDGHLALLTDITPFHPLDHKWPDQPADRGVVIGPEGVSIPLRNCLTAARNGETGILQFGSEISAGRGDDQWTYYCAHIVDQDCNLAVGDKVDLVVDAHYRHALNAAHTGCHLAALALNKTLRGFWKKDVRLDPLGNPDFDQLAIQTSKIDAFESFDAYRIGKSLKKRGFNAVEFWACSDSLTAQVNAQVAEWLAVGSDVHVTPARSGLTDMRTWECTLDDTLAQFPCGGSHLTSLDQLEAISVALLFDPDAATLVMQTKVTPAKQ